MRTGGNAFNMWATPAFEPASTRYPPRRIEGNASSAEPAKAASTDADRAESGRLLARPDVPGAAVRQAG
jgi:hypothetical protein